MVDDVVLKQSGLATAFHLVLKADRVEKRGDLLTSTSMVQLKDVLGVLRDTERVHIVSEGEPISFLNQPGKKAFDVFVAELVRRLGPT